MVAKITMPRTIQAALNYNEQKTKQDKAVCLHAANILSDVNQMNFYQKLTTFERLNSLNERATTKTLHVSLNFSPSEKISDNKLISIAETYMQRIGFGAQPFLVYKHEDTGHPHIHIVSTTIKADGRRINTHNIGRNQSELARKEIEQQFGLIKAERQTEITRTHIKPVEVTKFIYGKVETKQAIANTVTEVFNRYKFTSLPEYNAALKKFNVVADPGKKEGRMFKYGGLVYRVLDGNGKMVGVPIKASSINSKPILANLDKKFAANTVAKEYLKPLVKAKVDECLAQSPQSMEIFTTLLQQKSIHTILRQNDEGRLYGITFVDHQHKAVFNGSDVGKRYSVAAIQMKLQQPSVNPSSTTSSATVNKTIDHKGLRDCKLKSVDMSKDNMLNILISPELQYNLTPYSFLKKKRKKKRKNPEA